MQRESLTPSIPTQATLSGPGSASRQSSTFSRLVVACTLLGVLALVYHFWWAPLFSRFSTPPHTDVPSREIRNRDGQTSLRTTTEVVGKLTWRHLPPSARDYLTTQWYTFMKNAAAGSDRPVTVGRVWDFWNTYVVDTLDSAHKATLALDDAPEQHCGYFYELPATGGMIPQDFQRQTFRNCSCKSEVGEVKVLIGEQPRSREPLYLCAQRGSGQATFCGNLNLGQLRSALGDAARPHYVRGTCTCPGNELAYHWEGGITKCVHPAQV